MNLHNLFLQYNQQISLSPNRKQKLMKAKNSIQNTIRSHFWNDSRFLEPRFYIQGSYKMNTLILKNDNSYDVDLGVYFDKIPNVKPITLQKSLHKAVHHHTNAGAVHREKCVRIIYQGEFNVDLPIFYLDRSRNIPHLATKSGWLKSDPKEFVEWFLANNGRILQVQRLIKYLKAWAGSTRYKMPSGIALTVWACKAYVANDRDDLALLHTLKKIKSFFWWQVKCINPALPGDDLVHNLSSDQKDRFLDFLEELIDDLELSINDRNYLSAKNRLHKHFCRRFLIL